MVDLLVNRNGNIFLVQALTPLGRRWLETRLPHDTEVWHQAGVINHDDILGVIARARCDGLSIK